MVFTEIQIKGNANEDIARPISKEIAMFNIASLNPISFPLAN